MTCAVTVQAGCGSNSVAARANTIRLKSSIEEIRTRTPAAVLVTQPAAPIAIWPAGHVTLDTADGVTR